LSGDVIGYMNDFNINFLDAPTLPDSSLLTSRELWICKLCCLYFILYVDHFILFIAHSISLQFCSFYKTKTSISFAVSIRYL